MNFDASRRLAEALIAAYDDGADARSVIDAVHVLRPLDEPCVAWLKEFELRADVLLKADHAVRAPGSAAYVR